jgi:hypothetical protein
MKIFIFINLIVGDKFKNKFLINSRRRYIFQSFLDFEDFLLSF